MHLSLQKISCVNRFFIPAIAWLLLSVFLLTLPGNEFPEQSWTDQIPQFDKWVHIGMFAVMVSLFCWGLYKKGLLPARLRRLFIIVAAVCLVYGIGMEFVQKNFVPMRSFDTGDIIADAAGCAVGLLYSSRRYIKK